MIQVTANRQPPQPAGSNPALGGFAALALMTLACGLSAGATEAGHAHADIRAAAESEVRATRLAVDGRFDVVADELDPRVRLAACGQPLSTSIPYGNKRSQRLTVEVRCAAPKPWKLYVPVHLTIFQDVVVAARPLPRGTVLAADDVILAELDTISLARGYLLLPQHAIGQRIRRDLSAGDPVTPSSLQSPPLIRRGQVVNLEARSGGLTVRMSGIAKSDGILGQIIDVENKATSRRVQAIVRSRKSAEVLLN